MLFFSLYPVLLLCSFLGFVLLATMSLGHWPRFGDPDPKLIGKWGLYLRIQLMYGFGFFPFASLIAVALAFAGRLRAREFPTWRMIIITFAAAAALIAFGTVDPGGFLNWFWD